MKKIEIKLNLDKMAIAKLNESMTTQVKGGRSLLCFGSRVMSKKDINCNCCPQ